MYGFYLSGRDGLVGRALDRALPGRDERGFPVRRFGSGGLVAPSLGKASDGLGFVVGRSFGSVLVCMLSETLPVFMRILHY